MTSTKKDPVLVVLQLSGGNDYFNTVIPYTDSRYYDNRPAVGIAENRVLKINDKVGFHPEMAPLKAVYDEGNMAILHGVGYPNSPRSTSAPWTSGTPASRTSWAPRAGWAGPPVR